MKDNIPRQLIVADAGIEGSLVRASDTGTTPADEQAGLTVSQIPRTNDLVGDIRPSLSGQPEVATSGQIAVSQSGAEGNLRWGYVRDADSATADFQLRQLPTVAGRRPDVLHHDDSTSVDQLWAPKLAELTDGRLCLLYMVQDVNPCARDVNVGWVTAFRVAYLDPTDDEWTNPALTAGLGDYTPVPWSRITKGPFWFDFDVTVYPDSGEMVALVVGGTDDSGADTGIAACYASDDSGATWTLRSRLLFYQGAAPANTNPLLAGINEIVSVGIDRTRSGRLVALCCAQNTLFQCTSDDRGRSWVAAELVDLVSAYQSGDSSPINGVPIPAVALRRMRNGVLLGYVAINAVDQATAVPATRLMCMTADGVQWTVQANSTGLVRSHPSVGIAERPDGYPWIVCTVHDIYDGSNVDQLDELGAYVVIQRDPEPGDDPDDLIPNLNATLNWHLLCDAGDQLVNRPNAPAGELNTLSPVPTLDGFSAVGVANYRGQLVVAAVNQNQVDGEVGLLILRTDHHQPLQERLNPNRFDSLTLVATLRYLAGYSWTWDCYGHPTNWGFALTALGGADAITAPNADGGYFATQVAATNRYWRNATLPWPGQNHNAVLRCIVAPQSGGSLAAPEMAFLMELDDGLAFYGAHVRMAVVGSDVELEVHDNAGGAVGAKATLVGAAGQYLDVLLAIWHTGSHTTAPSVAAYVRPQDKATDPDWQVGYTAFGQGTLAAVVGAPVERIDFGHIATVSTAQARWKGLRMWRSSGTQDTLDLAPLAQQPVTYADDDTAIRTDTPRFVGAEDSGALNWMRPAQGIAYPAQFFDRGLHVEWRGQASVEGQTPYATDYTFGAKYLLDGSTPQREWRSLTTGAAIEIVLDAEITGGTGSLFNPRAIAMIGRNFPFLKVQFNSLDSWGAPTLSFALGVPGGSTGPYIRTSHMLDFSASSTLLLGAYRLTVQPPGGGSPFRPHQFASKEGGPRFYAVFVDNPSSGQHSVYRIADNDGDTLYFATNPVGTLISPTRVAIFSDRFAWDLTPRMPEGYLGFRFLRLLIEPVTHRDADEAFYRCGQIMLGQPAMLGPGWRWGFTGSTEPGSTLTRGITGATQRVRNHRGIRRWSVDMPTLLPTAEPTTDADMALNQGAASWQKVVDLTKRAEANGEPVILAADGLMFAGSVAANGQRVLTDPLDLARVRVINVGETQHEAYWCREEPAFGGGTDHRVREVQTVRRIVLEEDL